MRSTTVPLRREWMRRSSVIRVILLILAVGWIAIGLVTGEYREVYRKAVMICYECVGIG